MLEMGGLPRGAGARPFKTMLLTMKSLMKTRTGESRALVVSWLIRSPSIGPTACICAGVNKET